MDDNAAMRLALAEANRALDEGDLGIGAVVLDADGIVLGAAHDTRRATGDPTAHAVMHALRDAAAVLGEWRLTGCSLAVTLEPCAMCAGAAQAARLAAVVFGTPEPVAGALGSRYNLGVDPRLHHTFSVRSGMLAAPCAEVLVASRRTGSDVGTPITG